MIKIAMLQIRTETDQAETMEKARRMVYEAADKGVDMVCLPEMFNCPYSREYFKKYAALGHKEAYAAMSSWAREKQIYIVGGSIPETEDGKIYNTCFIFDREGREIARHRKMHLFDVDYDGLRVKESATFTPGSDITVFETKFGTMGCAICFDVRFPELFRAMAQRGAKLIFLPAQFSMTTGPRHWEPLIRSRALDYQLYMVGVGAARYVGFNYEAYGHSTVIGPSGIVECMADETEQIVYAEIELEKVEQFRAQMPTRKLMRTDVYTVME